MRVLILCFICYLTGYSALNLTTESLTGAFPAFHLHYKYQVAIVAQSSRNASKKLVGGGAIVAKQYVLTAAQNFFTDLRILKPHIFSIVVGSQNWKAKDSFEVNIKKIFYYEDKTQMNYDILLAKLSAHLDFGSYPQLDAIDLPNIKNTILIHSMGIVSGYGYNELERVENGVTVGNTDNKLRYDYVHIVDSKLCRAGYGILNEREMCGRTSSRYHQPSGICRLDAGNPLVTSNTIIGLAGKNKPNCDDSDVGAIYTNVSYFLNFIKGILDNNPDETVRSVPTNYF